MYAYFSRSHNMPLNAGKNGTQKQTQFSLKFLVIFFRNLKFIYYRTYIVVVFLQIESSELLGLDKDL